MYATLNKKRPNSITFTPETHKELNSLREVGLIIERWEKELNLYKKGFAPFPKFER